MIKLIVIVIVALVIVFLYAGLEATLMDSGYDRY